MLSNKTIYSRFAIGFVLLVVAAGIAGPDVTLAGVQSWSDLNKHGLDWITEHGLAWIDLLRRR